MGCKNMIRAFRLDICAVSCIGLLLLSCTAAIEEGKQPLDNRFLAENSMMKKRLPLLERESEVLKKENRQHRATIQKLDEEKNQLSEELISLNELYTKEKTASGEEIDNLHDTIEKIEKENSESIGALVAHNKNLEAKRAEEVAALGEQIERQKEAFTQERDRIIQDNAKRELDLSTQLAVLQKTLDPKEMEIPSLKLAINEISIQLGAATTLSTTLKKDRDEATAELESVKTANADLHKKIAELGSVKAENAELNQKLAELSSVKAENVELNRKLAELSSVKAANAELSQKLAELESVKAANVELSDKLAELTSQLSSQNSPVKTSP
jgi:chromosome segregation ATPase